MSIPNSTDLQKGWRWNLIAKLLQVRCDCRCSHRLLGQLQRLPKFSCEVACLIRTVASQLQVLRGVDHVATLPPQRQHCLFKGVSRKLGKSRVQREIEIPANLLGHYDHLQSLVADIQ